MPSAVFMRGRLPAVYTRQSPL